MNSQVDLVFLLGDCPADSAVVGGKAAGLARLIRAGANVPPGFVIMADAFRSYSKAGPWPEALRAAIERAFAELCRRTNDGPVAVRSSATSEDSKEASFAGQHATLLNIRGLDAVLAAVRECWASLHSEGAVAYRESRALQDADAGPAMAVVVQALVPAEAAGVAFTIDPVNDDRDVVLIDAAWGLGEGVVSGIVTPDRFAVRKRDGRIVQREVPTKRVRVVPMEDGGTRNEALPVDEAEQASLSDGQARQLAQIASKIEDALGGPQDIEWALAGGEFSILQSRPVTATATQAEGWVSEFDTPTSPDTIWTSANVQEVLPDQLSPLNVTMTNEIIDRFGADPAKQIGVKLKTPDPFSAYFYGRAFLNVSMMIEISDQTPFGSAEVIMEQYLGQHRDDFAMPPKARSLGRLWRYIVVAPRMLWFTFRLPEQIKRAEKIVETYHRDIAQRPFAQRADEELIETAERDLETSGEVAVIHVSGGGMTSNTFEMLRRVTERWLDDKNGVLQATLVTGLAGVESAQPAYELWDVSRLVVQSEQLRDAFAPAEGAEIQRRLAMLEGDDVAAFRKQFDAFLQHHGHRSVMEAEASARSWAEDHPTVYAMVRNYLHAGDSADPRHVEERQRKAREATTEAARKRLRWWQRLVFNTVLRDAQKWVVSREHTKALFMQAVHRGRLLSREQAHRLVARGKLDDEFDLYYLTWHEATALVRGELAPADARKRIEGRKAEEARNKHVLLPETFAGRPKPIKLSELDLPEDRMLRGIAVSPGRITGKARVIMDPRRDAGIEPGEILVAPVTDAGWTPLFIAAAGVVVDVGGTLSHGSTVAREYGLPAVVNVKHGTRMIRTGQTITVDGSEGIVVLEDGFGLGA